MPTYDYTCDACGHGWEEFQSMSAKPLQVCPECGKKKARRLIGAGAGLIFKGSGFYVTDYRKPAAGGSGSGEGLGSGGGSSGSDGASTGGNSGASSNGSSGDASGKPAAMAPSPDSGPKQAKAAKGK